MRPFWAILALAATSSAAAQSPHADLYDRVQLSGAVTTVILNTNIRIDPANGTGTELDAENDLGLARSKLEPRFALRWRPWRRQEFEFGYQFARRSSSSVLDRDIIFGDSTFHAGATIGTTLNSDQAFFAYRFAVLAKARTQVGLALGLGALFVDTGVDALASDGTSQYGQSVQLTGPVGSLGVYGRFLSGDRWSWEAEARYVGVSIDRFKAQVGEGGAAVRYAAWSRLMLEGGYGASVIRVDIASTTGSGLGSRSGRIKYSLQSVRLGLVALL